MILAILITPGYPESVGAGLHHGSPGVKSYVRTVIGHILGIKLFSFKIPAFFAPPLKKRMNEHRMLNMKYEGQDTDKKGFSFDVQPSMLDVYLWVYSSFSARRTS
jgi:hypothetical protein